MIKDTFKLTLNLIDCDFRKIRLLSLLKIEKTSEKSSLYKVLGYWVLGIEEGTSVPFEREREGSLNFPLREREAH